MTTPSEVVSVNAASAAAVATEAEVVQVTEVSDTTETDVHATPLTVTPVVPVTTPETSKEELGQNQQPNGLPERDGFDAEQHRQQVVPKQHHRTSENKYTCGNRYGDENGSFNPETLSSFSSMKHHNIDF